MTEKQGKIWGNTQRLFKGGSVEVHYIEAAAGGYCSRHQHRTRTNQFYVIQGELAILIWEANDQVDITVLQAGESTTIPIGVDHCFHAMEYTKAIEIYEARVMTEDIDRKWPGGRIKLGEMKSVAQLISEIEEMGKKANEK